MIMPVSDKKTFPLAIGVFLVLTSIYLLTMSRVWLYMDGEERYALIRSLVHRGSVAVGADEAGRPRYVKYGLGQPVLAVPFYLAGLGWGAASDTRLCEGSAGGDPERFCTNLYNQFVTGATCAVLALCLVELGYARSTALIVAGVFGLATGAWPNARWFGNEPTAALLILLVVFFLMRIVQRGEGTADWIGLGAAGALAMLNNEVMGPLLLLMMGVSVIWLKKRGPGPSRWRGRAAGIALLAAGAAAVLWYNAARYGTPFATGYEGDHGFRAFPYSGEPGFSTPLLVGIYGNLLSSGRSIFIYSPPVILGAVFFMRFRRRHAHAAALAAVAWAYCLVVYSKWWCWHGGACWGNRMLVPVVPLAMMPVAEAWEAVRGSRLKRACFIVPVAFGFVVQLLAVVVFHRWFFESVVGPNYEREYLIHFVPHFSPLAGQVRILAHEGLARHDLFLAWLLGVRPALAIAMILVVAAMAAAGAALVARARGSRATGVSAETGLTIQARG